MCSATLCNENVISHFTSERYCEECGSSRLGMVRYPGPHFRKECLSCGSAGPFPLSEHRCGIEGCEQAGTVYRLWPGANGWGCWVCPDHKK